jgi:hypothetical protein
MKETEKKETLPTSVSAAEIAEQNKKYWEPLKSDKVSESDKQE